MGETNEFAQTPAQEFQQEALKDISIEEGKIETEHRNEHQHGAQHGSADADGEEPDTSSADSVKSFGREKKKLGEQDNEAGDLENNAPLKRFRTGIFSPRLKDHRKKILRIFLQTNAILGGFCIAILSIYWGATYKREHYMFKVNVLSVMQDESTLVPLTMTQELPELISTVPCTWHIYSQNEFMEKYNVSKAGISDKVRDLVYEEKYWMALNVKPNSTNDLYNTLSENSGNFVPADYFDVWYLSGRDPTSVKASILPNMQDLEAIYSTYYQTKYLPQLISNITANDEKTGTISAATLINASNMQFNYIDYRPFYDNVLLSPLQVGLIYCLLLTFFQISLFGPLHAEMAQFLTPKNMLIYRICISWLTYFLLSLFFCTISAIYQINFTLAFGRGGFVIYWMSTWLLMMALGGANENMITLILCLGPQYLGFWLMTWIVLNIACSFYPLALNNEFYRYGYAMPIHNGIDIFKVIFMNLSRHNMGRNYGILVAWVAINTSVFPFVMKIVSKSMEKKKAAAAASSNSPNN